MSLVGTEVWELDTPVLWVDLELMESNIQRFANFMKEVRIGWRPHTKGIKIPAIAHKLIDAGALGITCSKLSEAEVMAMGGIKDILVANQVVGAAKIQRLVNLQHYAAIMVAVDDLGNARAISEAAEKAGTKVKVLIELNTGMDRSGITPGVGVVGMAKGLQTLPGIALSGVMGWEGHVCKIEDPLEKEFQTRKAVSALVSSAQLCRQAGIEMPIVSCGGTGSYRITAHLPGVTEIQAGGGVFGDVTYRRWGAGMDCALFVLATVTSHPAPARAVVDAGRKAMNAEYSLPEVKDLSGVRVGKLSAEHGVLEIDPAIANLRVGDKINFITGYEDLTVFLYDQLVGVRNGKVEVVWDISGRGKLT